MSHSPGRLRAILDRVELETTVAMRRFDPFNSPHEGKAVIEEELDELWLEVKANNGRTPEAIQEAIQVAAMAVRYVYDMEAEPTCMCMTEENVWRPCPETLCEREDHNHHTDDDGGEDIYVHGSVA